jgi:predicted nucleotidyltransferase
VTDLERALRGLAAELDARGRRWALVGGLAVGTRAEPRTTRDVDAAVAVADDAEAEALVNELSASGYRIGPILEHDALERLATVRLIAPSSRVLVDLLFASSGIEADVADAAERLEIVRSLVVPVARTGHLIALKLLARDDRRRPQDHDDLRALKRAADDYDWQLAADAVAAIERAGAARGRDLTAALAELRSES